MLDSIENLITDKRIMVTGAAGFIGAHVVRRLLAEGFEVVGVDNLNNYYDPRLKEARLRRLCIGPRFWFFPMDLADRGVVESLFASGKFDAVIHLAAQAGVRRSLSHADEYVSSNLIAFVNLLEGLRACRCRHFLFASSSSVYGTFHRMPLDESHSTDQPISLYAATKKSNEVLAHAYSHLYGIPTTGLRFFTVYGPWGRPDMAAFKFVDAILAGRTIDLYNSGDLRRDFTYVEDVVEALMRLLPQPPQAGMRILNVGSGRPIALLDMVRTLELCLGKQADVRFLPMQPGDVYETHASTARLRELTSFSPRVPLADGMQQFVAWYLRDYLPLGLAVPPPISPRAGEIAPARDRTA